MKKDKKIEQLEIESEDILESVLAETENRKIDGVVTGVFEGFSDNQNPLVSHDFCNMKTEAKSLVSLSDQDCKRDVALMFENGNLDSPIIMGLMQESPKHNVFVDGEKQEITAKSEILLKCGKSSILMREDGKIVIKGTNIISRALESNKIRGGSVKIN